MLAHVRIWLQLEVHGLEVVGSVAGDAPCHTLQFEGNGGGLGAGQGLDQLTLSNCLLEMSGRAQKS